MIHTDPAAVATAMHEAIARAERILILTHENPDGDAIGSMLGLWHSLHAMGKTAIPLASSPYPPFLATLPGIEHVQVYQPGMPLPAADLTWMLDTASPARVGAVHTDHAAALAARPLVIVDHHVTNEGAGMINLIDTGAASTAELLTHLLQVMDMPITADSATCLLMGITTDTQSFQTSSSNSRSLRVAADLIDAGANQRGVVQAIYFATPYATAHLMGLSLAALQREDSLIWTHISQAMLQASSADDGAYDEVVGVMQRIDGVEISVLFKELADGNVKISLRSRQGIDVSAVARIWGGGGHKQAAGATLHMGLAAAEQAVLPVLRETIAAATPQPAQPV